MKESAGIFPCLILSLLILVSSCGNLNTDKDSTSPYIEHISIELNWFDTRDHFGEFDKENDEAAVELAIISPQENYIAAGSRMAKNLVVYNTEKERVFEYTCSGYVQALAFSKDEKYLFVGGKFNNLIVFETNTWKVVGQKDFPCAIESAELANNGETIALGRYDGYISLYDAKNFNHVADLSHKGRMFTDSMNNPRADVNAIDFSDDDKFLVSGGFDGNIKVWYLPQKKLIKTIRAHDASIKSVRISKDNKCIASASAGEPYVEDNSIRIWDFKSGEQVHELTFPMGMESVEFSPDGNYFVGGGQEGKFTATDSSTIGHIYFYSLPKDLYTEAIRQIHKESVFRTEYLCFNRSGTQLLSSHEDGTLRLWDIDIRYSE